MVRGDRGVPALGLSRGRTEGEHSVPHRHPDDFTVPVFADVTDAMGLSTVLESDLNRNHSAGAGWLEVRLARTTSNRDACGARAVLTSGPSAQARWVVCGSSLGTGTDTVLPFGGLPVESFRLDIDWPSGRHQTVLDGGLDRLMTVTEG